MTPPYFSSKLEITMGYVPEKGRWIIIRCQKCTNVAGHWSKNGKNQKRKYLCESCTKSINDKIKKAVKKDQSHLEKLSK